MNKDYMAAIMRLHNTPVYCADCHPAAPVEVPARIFYRLKDDDLIACPRGHRGSLRDFKEARDNFGERHGPFIRPTDPETSGYADSRFFSHNPKAA